MEHRHRPGVARRSARPAGALQLFAATGDQPAGRRGAGPGRGDIPASAAQPHCRTDHPGCCFRCLPGPVRLRDLCPGPARWRPGRRGPGRGRPGHARGAGPGLEPAPVAGGADSLRADHQPVLRDPEHLAGAGQPRGLEQSVHLAIGFAEPEQLAGRVSPGAAPWRGRTARRAAGPSAATAGPQRCSGRQPGPVAQPPAPDGSGRGRGIECQRHCQCRGDRLRRPGRSRPGPPGRCPHPAPAFALGALVRRPAAVAGRSGGTGIGAAAGGRNTHRHSHCVPRCAAAAGAADAPA